jgi:hypothetical protein
VPFPGSGIYRLCLAAKTSFKALYIIFEALFVLYYSYVENCLISSKSERKWVNFLALWRIMLEALF